MGLSIGRAPHLSRLAALLRPLHLLQAVARLLRRSEPPAETASLRGARINVSDKGNRTSLTDMLIGGHHFEVKTASLGANSTFQFNHIRMDRRYECLLCLGICPHEIVFNAWRKGDVAEEKAGRLVRMAEGQAVTYKLTKRLPDMKPISALQQFLLTDWNIKARAATSARRR